MAENGYQNEKDYTKPYPKCCQNLMKLNAMA